MFIVSVVDYDVVASALLQAPDSRAAVGVVLAARHGCFGWTRRLDAARRF